MSVHETDCRTPDGIATGLVDGILTNLRVLRRHYSEANIDEPLKDLVGDEDFAWLLRKEVTTRLEAFESTPEIIEDVDDEEPQKEPRWEPDPVVPPNRPCPFCGSPVSSAILCPNSIHLWWVHCVGCGASSDACEFPEDAETLWNRRFSAKLSNRMGLELIHELYRVVEPDDFELVGGIVDKYTEGA